MIAKRLTETKTEGEYEIKTFHIVHLDINQDVLQTICEDELNCYDDYEESFINGMAINYNDSISWIRVEPFVKRLESYIKEKVEDDGEEELNPEIRKVLEILKPHTEYILDFEEEIEE